LYDLFVHLHLLCRATERGRERGGERGGERERGGVIRRRRNESGGSGEFNEAETGKAVEPEPGLREVVS